MSLTLDLSTDFETIVDNLETATLLRRVPAAESLGGLAIATLTEDQIATLTEDQIATLREYPGSSGYHACETPSSETLTKCLRRNVNNAEVAASNGKYLAGDTRWHLSANELTLPPRVGDVLRDSGNHDYTFLEVRYDTFNTRWRCVSRDLRIVHCLTAYVTLQVRTITKGASGAAEDTWTDLYTSIPARVQELRADTLTEGGARRSEKSYEVWIADDLDVNQNHRLQAADGTTYQILGHADRENIALMQVLLCQEWRRG